MCIVHTEYSQPSKSRFYSHTFVPYRSQERGNKGFPGRSWQSLQYFQGLWKFRNLQFLLGFASSRKCFGSLSLCAVPFCYECDSSPNRFDKTSWGPTRSIHSSLTYWWLKVVYFAFASLIFICKSPIVKSVMNIPKCPTIFSIVHDNADFPFGGKGIVVLHYIGMIQSLQNSNLKRIVKSIIPKPINQITSLLMSFRFSSCSISTYFIANNYNVEIE